MNVPDQSFGTHGGPDALGAPGIDFSTNSNACGPCPLALRTVQNADASRYPDPHYAVLRQRLAEFHGVTVGRIVLAGSASEFIYRFTAWVAQAPAVPLADHDQPGKRRPGGQDGQGVHLPLHSYGDYAQAARAWGLALATECETAALVWACEPSSPLGQAHQGWPRWLKASPAVAPAMQVPENPPDQRDRPEPARQHLVLDRAYAPLRLSGASSLGDAQLAQVWQMFTPNKALGLTGVRAAYVIAPLHADASVLALQRLCPSWPVGAHGVAMLQAWGQPQVQAWLQNSLHTLRDWKSRQIACLCNLGWTCLPSDANYLCAQPPQPLDLTALRQSHGIKLRDATSFGLPGLFRLGVLAPQAQDALLRAVSPRFTSTGQAQ